MTEIVPGVPKPPPLHERSDIFDKIAASYKDGNNLGPVQERFRGALMPFFGTAIPKNHDKLVASIQSGAAVLDMDDDKDVTDTVDWIVAEKARHPPKPAKSSARSIDDHHPDHAERHATKLGA